VHPVALPARHHRGNLSTSVAHCLFSTRILRPSTPHSTLVSQSQGGETLRQHGCAGSVGLRLPAHSPRSAKGRRDVPTSCASGIRASYMIPHAQENPCTKIDDQRAPPAHQPIPPPPSFAVQGAAFQDVYDFVRFPFADGNKIPAKPTSPPSAERRTGL
jgi:hypothetical protein